MTESSENDSNPYATPKSDGGDRPRRAGVESPWKLVLTGAGWSVFSAFPIAALMALMYRFPIPLVGYRSGSDAVLPAMYAVVFYGVMLGGFIILPVLGAITGLLIAISYRANLQLRKWLVRIASSTVTAVCLLMLDKVLKVLRW